MIMNEGYMIATKHNSMTLYIRRWCGVGKILWTTNKHRAMISSDKGSAELAAEVCGRNKDWFVEQY